MRYRPSQCFLRLCQDEEMAREIDELRTLEPEHVKMMEEGWSWIECVSGPLDGARHYFVGPPSWEIVSVDPSIDPDKYQEGDLIHVYKLRRGEGDGTVYRYFGCFGKDKPKRRPKGI